MRPRVALVLRQFLLVAGAVLAYFGVRGLTEGDVARADSNAELVLRVERAIHLDIERGLQTIQAHSDTIVTLSNWVYIWLHWPVVIATLVWLLIHRRDDYDLLRNAMFISGAIGLVIFATFPVTPPRLLGVEYVDTVTERSYSYRVLQPPALVNKYAAVPSLHFGWNLLVGLVWARVATTRLWRIAAVAMPVAMGWAVVATGNHWVLDVVLGGAIALIGLAIELLRRHARRRRRAADADTVAGAEPCDVEPCDVEPAASAPAGRTARATDEAAGRHPGLVARGGDVDPRAWRRRPWRRTTLPLAAGVDGIGTAATHGAPTNTACHDSTASPCG